MSDYFGHGRFDCCVWEAIECSFATVLEVCWPLVALDESLHSQSILFQGWCS